MEEDFKILEDQIKKIINKLVINNSELKMEEVHHVDVKLGNPFDRKEGFIIEVKIKVMDFQLFEEYWDKLYGISINVRDAIKYVMIEKFYVDVIYYDSEDDRIASYGANSY